MDLTKAKCKIVHLRQTSGEQNRYDRNEEVDSTEGVLYQNWLSNTAPQRGMRRGESQRWMIWGRGGGAVVPLRAMRNAFTSGKGSPQASPAMRRRGIFKEKDEEFAIQKLF